MALKPLQALNVKPSEVVRLRNHLNQVVDDLNTRLEKEEADLKVSGSPAREGGG